MTAVDGSPICTMMHEPSALHGWDIIPITRFGRHVRTHLVPCGDLRRHQLDPTCWCDPTQDDEDEKLWGHHAADGREAYEEGKKPS